MCNLSEWVVRSAYLAYSRGDLAELLDLIAPDLEWAFSDGSGADAAPQVGHGRAELAAALRRQPDTGPRPELTEVVASGDQVMVVLRAGPAPQPDAAEAADGGTTIFTVVTVRDGRIVALRACHDRAEARVLAGIS